MQPDSIIHHDISSANILLEPRPSNGWRDEVSNYGSANFFQQLSNRSWQPNILGVDSKCQSHRSCTGILECNHFVRPSWYFSLHDFVSFLADGGCGTVLVNVYSGGIAILVGPILARPPFGPAVCNCHVWNHVYLRGLATFFHTFGLITKGQ